MKIIAEANWGKPVFVYKEIVFDETPLTTVDEIILEEIMLSNIGASLQSIEYKQ